MCTIIHAADNNKSNYVCMENMILCVVATNYPSVYINQVHVIKIELMYTAAVQTITVYNSYY